MRNIRAVFTKQVLSFFKNPSMYGAPAFFLLLPIMFVFFVPGLAENANLVVAQFVVLFVGISMIGTASGFLAEDRATMNLRFMGMAGVKPYQYLIGTCVGLILISFVAIIAFSIIGGLWRDFVVFGNFIIVSMLGAICSMLLGITLSLTKLAPFTMIFAMVLGIGPIFAEANDSLANIFEFVYTHRVNITILEYLYHDITETLRVIFLNMAILLVAFIFTSARRRLDD